MTFPPHTAPWGIGKNAPLYLVGKENKDGHYIGTNQSRAKIGGHRTPLPNKQRDSNHTDQYTLALQRWRKRPSTRGLLGHTHPENGPMAWSNF